MSWNASKPVESVRQEFVKRLSDPGVCVTSLCKEFGVSRKTAYKWKLRAGKGERMSDRSRRPHTSPRSTAVEVVDQIVALREAHPSLGGGKISIMLKRKGIQGVPSGTTITGILRKKGLLDPRAVAEASRIIRFVKSRPNEMWQMDFKGNFELATGKRCHPLNIIDDYSRFCVCARPLLGETLNDVRPAIVDTFCEYGKPETLLCDNGNPWGAKGRSGITAFEVWAMEHDILVIHGRPLHPQTQGKDERFNKSIKRELLQKMGARPDLLDVVSEFEAYRCFYNRERPHYGISGMVPSDLYHPSDRRYDTSVCEWEYPLNVNVRSVGKGYLSFRGRHYFVGEGLAGKRIGLVSGNLEDCVDVTFRDFLIGRINLREGKTVFMRCYRMNNDPRQKPHVGK